MIVAQARLCVHGHIAGFEKHGEGVELLPKDFLGLNAALKDKHVGHGHVR